MNDLYERFVGLLNLKVDLGFLNLNISTHADLLLSKLDNITLHDNILDNINLHKWLPFTSHKLSIVDYSDTESTDSINDDNVSYELVDLDDVDNVDNVKDVEYYLENELDSFEEESDAGIEDINSKVAFSVTYQDNPKLIYEGYEFMYEKSYKDKIYWRCIFDDPVQCRARIHTNQNHEILKLSKLEHYHQNKENKIVSELFCLEIKSKAAKTKERPRTIIKDCLLNVTIEIIKKHCEQKIATSILAKEYSVNTSTISTILSSKENILEHFEKNLCGTEKKRIKLSSFDDVDKAVLFWFEQVQKYSNVTVSGIEIQLQALKYATMLGHRGFKAMSKDVSPVADINQSIHSMIETFNDLYISNEFSCVMSNTQISVTSSIGKIVDYDSSNSENSETTKKTEVEYYNEHDLDDSCDSLQEENSDEAGLLRASETSENPLTHTCENFVLFDSGSVDPQRIIIFGTTKNLELLNSKSTWFIDGTFDISPDVFTQLFTFNIIKGGKNLPLVYAFLPNKEQPSYGRVFMFISKNVSNKPEFIVSDFEQAILNCVPILPFVPLMDTFYAFEFIKSQSLAELAPVIHYFEKNYIGFVDPEDENCSRVVPKFPPGYWNLRKRIQKGLPRSNNSLDTWHKSLSQDFGSHPNVNKLANYLKNEQHLTDVLIKNL
ncbi:hypothetical protein BpHYR1_018914 [Brachionus plicatilis]|uniref:FLYWCH-type domain-containing protein n=1 Tax=Brachionus plicatilis TaxID=10195 RepID=A0A3M7S7D4_BRAPC|nr:hypothetical protein BpHYR1_018914 [Brachionus plicatilis]